jgi:hypothetical protein
MKAGVDDFLVTHGVEALQELLESPFPFDPALSDEEVEVSWQTKDLTRQAPLPETLKRLAALTPTLALLSNVEVAAILEALRGRLKLRAEDLASLKADVKKARKEREVKGKKGQGKPREVSDLQESLRLHPAIDFLGEATTIGFRVDLPEKETGLLLVISDGKGVKYTVNQEKVEIGERVYQVILGTAPPFLQDVWNLNRLTAFLNSPNRPQNLFTKLKEAFRKYLDFPEPAYGLLAAWAVGTHFAHLFTAFPFLHFYGPKESGKSKSLEALMCVCFNAWKGRDITAAALGDTADGLRGTLLLDQAEKLTSDKENGNLIGLLADSYKKAGGKRRLVEITKAGRTVLEFSTYGPKAFASTRNLDPDLRDRCVRIPMTRTRRKLPDLEGWEPIWGELRDKLYRFTLAAFKEVGAAYRAIRGDGTRIGELWRPMLAVIQTLGVDHGEIDTIRALFMAAAEETRHEPSPWETRLLEVMQEEAGKNTQAFGLTVAEVIDLMGIQGDKKPTRKWAGDTLSQFHLYQRKGRVKIKGEKETAYQFDPAGVIELCSLYLREDGPAEKGGKKYGNTPGNDLSHLSPGDNANDFNRFEGTRENQGTRHHLSPLGEERNEGHEGTCPPERTCPPETLEIADSDRRGHEGHEESGGMAEKFSQSSYPDLLEGEL